MLGARTCRSKMGRIGGKSREIVDEIREKPQMSKSQGFVHDNPRKYHREKEAFFSKFLTFLGSSIYLI
jgi:hypothetical protein